MVVMVGKNQPMTTMQSLFTAERGAPNPDESEWRRNGFEYARSWVKKVAGGSNTHTQPAICEVRIVWRMGVAGSAAVLGEGAPLGVGVRVAAALVLEYTVALEEIGGSPHQRFHRRGRLPQR